MQPTLESRVESLELRTSKTEAGFMQLSSTLVTKQDVKQEIQQAYLYIGDTINTVISEMNKQIEPIAKRLDRIEQDVSDLKATQTEQGTKLDRIEQDVSDLKATQTEQGTKLDRIEQDVSDLKATQTEQGTKLDRILELLKKS